MSNKKKRARLKKQREEIKKEQENTKDNKKKCSSVFINVFTGSIFLLTAIVCVIGAIAILLNMQNSIGKYANAAVLAIMAVYFFWKVPGYFRKNHS